MFDFVIFCHEIHGDISGKGPRPGIRKVLFPATPLVRAHTALGFKKKMFFFFFPFFFLVQICLENIHSYLQNLNFVK